jgi:hypothetical protein
MDPVSAFLTIYALAGLVLASAFLAVGIDRIDESAHGAYAVRALLLPSLAILWPLVAWRWRTLARRRS